MSVSLQKETEVIDFVNAFSQVVKGQAEGVEPTDGELDLLLARLDRIEAFAVQMLDQYPELPTALDRMRLRLYVLMSNRPSDPAR